MIDADSVMIKVDLKGVDLGSPTAGETEKGIAYSPDDYGGEVFFSTGKQTNGGDLLAALKAGKLDTVSPALIATWPGGANAGFPARLVAP